MLILKMLGVAWLFMAYTYIATYYTAVMRDRGHTEEQKTFVHVTIGLWFLLSIKWYFNLF